MKKQPQRSRKNFSLPLSPRETLMIIDRDATIISSREIAYACYRASFAAVVAKADPAARLLSEEEFSRDYHPFTRTGIYEVYYPGLGEDELQLIGEISWKFYLAHYHQPEFNLLIPGMDDCLQTLRAAGGVIIILTVSEAGGEWLQHYRIPVDGYFSLTRMKKEGVISGGKPEAIRHILDRYGKSPREAVTIGDNPKDHVEEVLSIGTAFGLACPGARRDLENAVDIYIPRVENLREVFSLSPAQAIPET